MAAQQHQNRMKEHLREGGEQAQSLVDRCCDVTEQSIKENPMLATLAAFGVGIGIGATLGALLAEPSGSSRRRTAETLGRRMLDSLADSLPSSVKQHIHS